MLRQSLLRERDLSSIKNKKVLVVLELLFKQNVRVILWMKSPLLFAMLLTNTDTAPV